MAASSPARCDGDAPVAAVVAVTPELVGVIEEKLRGGTYECVVCTEVLGIRDRLWSCRTCFGLFHLPCIIYWVKSQTEQQRLELQHGGSRPAGSGRVGETFRCPLCQSMNSSATVREYRCYCGKRLNPAPDPMITLGSCGDTCGRRRADEKCVHPCTLLCHPGPCPPCAQTRSQECFCGAEERLVGCSSGMEGWECGNVCGKELECGRHYCERLCHSGSCAPCTAEATVTCYCGQTHVMRPCARDLGFSCGKPCPRMRDCEKHPCGQTCHDGPCSICLRLPSRQSTCPCGQSPLWKLYYELPELPARNGCTDPVPTCGAVCSLPLPCGEHLCSTLCHDTDTCPPCCQTVSIACRCGAQVNKKAPCFVHYLPQAAWAEACRASGLNERTLPPSFPFSCTKRCKASLSCGRHQCDEVCCTNVDHQCMQVCRKKAPCGIHECGRLCHKGPCPPCMNSSYQRLYCRCRRTFIEPPIPCGTLPPNCLHPCVVPRECGHPPNHTCHIDDKCPECVVPVEKYCASHGKKLPYLRPCHLKSLSCGNPCRRVQTCCNVVCNKVCHSGPCAHKCTHAFPDLGRPPATGM